MLPNIYYSPDVSLKQLTQFVRIRHYVFFVQKAIELSKINKKRRVAFFPNIFPKNFPTLQM